MVCTQKRGEEDFKVIKETRKEGREPRKDDGEWKQIEGRKERETPEKRRKLKMMDNNRKTGMKKGKTIRLAGEERGKKRKRKEMAGKRSGKSREGERKTHNG